MSSTSTSMKKLLALQRSVWQASMWQQSIVEVAHFIQASFAALGILLVVLGHLTNPQQLE